MNRRTTLPALAAALLSLALPAAAPEPVSEPDPYDQRNFAPNLEQILARCAANSEATRERLGPPQRFAYGFSADEMLDVYASTQTNAPIHVFIHGGAWRFGYARDNAHFAELFVDNGIHCIVPDFSPVQTFDGDLTPMVRQLEQALVWIYRNAAAEFGGNPQRIHLSGFSSGAHLASVLLTTDWSSLGEDLPADLIRGAVLVSGMYDLAPVALSSRRSYVNFTPAVIHELSLIRHLDKICCPLVIAYGTEESPAFQEHARALAAALEYADIPHTLLVGRHYNHFEIIETLGNPFGLLGRVALDQIKGSAK
jgi:arylformamidase